MHALEDLLTSLLQWNMTPQGLQVMVEVCSHGDDRGGMALQGQLGTLRGG